MTKTEHIKKLIKENPALTRKEIMQITGARKTLVNDVAGSFENRTGFRHFGNQNGSFVNGIKIGETPGCTKDFKKDSATVEFRTNEHIKDIDTALREQGIDLNLWTVERVVTYDNAWDVTMKLGDEAGDHIEAYTNYQFKIVVFLKRRPDAPIIRAVESIIKKIPQFRFKRPPMFASKTGVAMEIAPLDAHMGKFAWAKETGRRDYDLNNAVSDYLTGIETTLSWGEPFKPEKIFYIVGQDLMHVENFMGVTPKGGNVLDVDSRLPKIFEAAMETVIKSVYLCRSVAETEVIWIPGNHDMHASLFLCMALKQHFRDDGHVVVDTSPIKRKSRLWGNLLVGFTHEIVGKHQSWSNELAQAFPVEWGKSDFREWHHGHKHKKSEIKTFPTVTQGGVVLRQLTALSPIDAWHFENLFTDAVPGSEAFLWSDKHGVFANFVAWTDNPIKKDMEA